MSRDPLHFTEKTPPSFDGYGDYQQYRENVALWDVMTSVDQSRKAPTVIGRLSGQAQVIAKTLSIETLTSADGLTKLLEELDKKFGLDKISLLHKNVSEFFDFVWDRNDTVDEFVIGFHSRLEKISTLALDETLKGHILLRQANLDPHDRNIIIGSAGGNYSLQSLSTALRNAFRAEGMPATSMNTSRPIILRSDRGNYKSRRVTHASSGSSSNHKDDADEATLFYSFVSAEGLDKASAIVDSGACASVVGKETLDSALRALGIEELKDEPIRQEEHRFGPSDSVLKTMCAVRVPFVCATSDGKEVRFHIRFDVIPGQLPFLIGLPSLRAMAGNLSFKHNNLSMVINKTLYRIQLVYKNSHLCLPLRSKSTFSKPVGPSSGMVTSARHTRQPYRPGPGINSTGTNFHYYVPAASEARTPPTTKEPARFKNTEVTSDSATTALVAAPDQDTSSRRLDEKKLQKLHKQLGHGTFTQVQKFVRDANLWRAEYGEMLRKVIDSCPCNLAAPPVPRPVCSASPLPSEPQTSISIDVVYFNTKPFLHCVDQCTRWSETGALRSRRLRDQIAVFNRIQINRHGNPLFIRADQEFNKEEFLAFCRDIGATPNFVAANHHEGNAVVERANRSIRSYFERITRANPNLILVDAVSAATFYKNICRGHGAASSFELLYKRSPRVTEICEPKQPGTIQQAARDFRRRQLQSALKARVRTHDGIQAGELVHIWRDGRGWIGPARVTSVQEHAVRVKHNGRSKTADKYRVRRVTSATLDSDEDSTDARPPSTTAPPTVDPAENVAAAQPSPYPSRPRISKEARRLAAEAEKFVGELSGPRTKRNPTHHLTAPTPSQPPQQINQVLSASERVESYNKEKGSWIDAAAYERIDKSRIPSGSNIIGSHVVYKRKSDGTPKARIVPWGHRDADKDEVRGDAPSLNLDSMRIVISMAVEQGWTLRKMDVKSAYLQAKGFDRDVYVRPPREENDKTGLWKLLKPAYGLTESGRLWYLTSYQALTADFGFTRSRYDPSLYYKKQDKEMLILVVQVDDYLYAGTPALSSEFESFLQKQFHVGTLESRSFDIMGARLQQHPSGHVTLNAKEKLDAVELLSCERIRNGTGDGEATPAELSAYRSVIGKLLYIGRLVSPVISFHASTAAMKCAALRLHHLKALNATLKVVKNYSATLSFQPPQGSKFRLEAMSDASMKKADAQANVREGYIIFRRSGDSTHPISWTSRRARRVARSTSTAELLAAADAVDKVTYLKHLLEELQSSQTTELVVDSRSIFSLCSTMKEPEEAKNKIILATIREEHNEQSLSTIRWTPGAAHLADALTKENPVIAAKLEQVLQSGRHSHDPSSFTATSDMPASSPSKISVTSMDGNAFENLLTPATCTEKTETNRVAIDQKARTKETTEINEAVRFAQKGEVLEM